MSNGPDDLQLSGTVRQKTSFVLKMEKGDELCTFLKPKSSLSISTKEFLKYLPVACTGYHEPRNDEVDEGTQNRQY